MASRRNLLYSVLREPRHVFDQEQIVRLFGQVSEDRVESLADRLSVYITTNLPAAMERRDGLADYRTNPYVLMTSASVLSLADPARFAAFLFNSKLYMALETSFGKSVEAAFLGQYPIDCERKWIDPPEKIAEFAGYKGLSREEKARRRTQSVWREIDKSVVIANRRYLTTIKSGPNTINDTQVQAMTAAIAGNHRRWSEQTRESHPEVTAIEIIIGLTYGTDRTTNNKENQLLAKLLNEGFVEEDRERYPGVLIDADTRSTRVYRCIGSDFWATIGNPDDPDTAKFVFLEILLGLAKALSTGMEAADLETRLNLKLQALANALANVRFSRGSLPQWVREDFSEDELFWFATAITAFYDEGI